MTYHKVGLGGGGRAGGQIPPGQNKKSNRRVGVRYSEENPLVTAHPEIPAARNFDELKAHILDIVAGGSKKRKSPDS